MRRIHAGAAYTDHLDGNIRRFRAAQSEGTLHGELLDFREGFDAAASSSALPASSSGAAAKPLPQIFSPPQKKTPQTPSPQNTPPPPMTPSISTAFPAERILLGPGPSPVPQRVLRALGAPTLGHLDPQYLAIMDETCERLRQVFRTKNALTFPVSGTGMAGMECVATNLIEPGDEVIVCVNGVFGTRMKDVMERCGATVHAVEAPWGDVISAGAAQSGAGAASEGEARGHRPRRDQHRRAPAARRLCRGGA